jgi:hypothetical protein
LPVSYRPQTRASEADISSIANCCGSCLTPPPPSCRRLHAGPSPPHSPPLMIRHRPVAPDTNLRSYVQGVREPWRAENVAPETHLDSEHAKCEGVCSLDSVTVEIGTTAILQISQILKNGRSLLDKTSQGHSGLIGGGPGKYSETFIV